MKKINIISRIVVFLALLLVSNEFFRYILIDDTSSYTRIMIYEMYEQDNIDILFLGSSHCYRSVDVSLMDEILGGENTFNAGTSGQGMDGSLALLKEAGKTSEISEVYLEMYYFISTRAAYKDRGSITSTYIISDYLNLSFNKIDYLLNASSNDHYVNSFILARRNWEYLFDWDYLTELYQAKQEDSYINYEYFSDYAGKGFVSNSSSKSIGSLYSKGGYDAIEDSTFDEDYLGSFYEIVEYCEENDIKLTLFSAPISAYRLASIGNYDSYIEQVESLIEGYDIEYYDFNLCTTDYLLLNETNFTDDHHLNSTGATMFTELLGNIILGTLDVNEMFYADTAEKFADSDTVYFGTDIESTDNEYQFIPITSSEEYVSDISYIITYGEESLEVYPNDDNEFWFKLPESYSEDISVEIFYDGESVGSFSFS